jgi:tRNA(Arg) A34 adenosine deaminase TadA
MEPQPFSVRWRTFYASHPEGLREHGNRPYYLTTAADPSLPPTLATRMDDPQVIIEQPAWVNGSIDWDRRLETDDERMRLAIRLARENVERGTGGPFGAIVVERDSGRLVGIGMNSVVRLNNSTLHGEMVAFMSAQQRVRSYTLGAPGMPVHELVTSCEPCAMCLGAALWSGVRRIVCGALREDATRLNFEEGPVFPQSYRYLEERGIEIVRGVLRDEARAVLEQYRKQGGKIYNA